eukprot:CAMPEP_0170178900 /NCGR_PEP_ID=MMETSP0040_2-20121228/14882_1 /TAXON_ID=641309 /ORGANISM="Lotharella oceanica, Strain CCMP622" /LENGTH=120 /DNA_ID=CAMNT_0010422527 /DNA_START=27 /DNA_END=386 /DNA_ORIENTATION=+
MSFENDTDREFEVSICLKLGEIVIDKKRIKPGDTWSKTDKGISASMVYIALVEDLVAPLVFRDGKYQTPKWRCPVKAPAVKGEKRYKLSELTKNQPEGGGAGESKGQNKQAVFNDLGLQC